LIPFAAVPPLAKSVSTTALHIAHWENPTALINKKEKRDVNCLNKIIFLKN
jgi:hypothetical protein